MLDFVRFFLEHPVASVCSVVSYCSLSSVTPSPESKVTYRQCFLLFFFPWGSLQSSRKTPCLRMCLFHWFFTTHTQGSTALDTLAFAYDLSASVSKNYSYFTRLLLSCIIRGNGNCCFTAVGRILHGILWILPRIYWFWKFICVIIYDIMMS